MEYEDLPVICFHCGKYGHTIGACKESEQGGSKNVENTDKRWDAMAVHLENRSEMEEIADLGAGNGGVGLGSWIHAPKRGRRRTINAALTEG